MMNIIESLKTAYAAWLERRFLKKHRCNSRAEYDRYYDVDVCWQSTKVKAFYKGYPYVQPYLGMHYQDVWMSKLTLIKEWCTAYCSDKWRQDTFRVIKGGPPYRWDEGNGEWEMDEMGGGDIPFFAFKSERDLIMFNLRWGS